MTCYYTVQQNLDTPGYYHWIYLSSSSTNHPGKLMTTETGDMSAGVSLIVFSIDPLQEILVMLQSNHVTIHWPPQVLWHWIIDWHLEQNTKTNLDPFNLRQMFSHPPVNRKHLDSRMFLAIKRTVTTRIHNIYGANASKKINQPFFFYFSLREERKMPLAILIKQTASLCQCNGPQRNVIKLETSGDSSWATPYNKTGK